MLVFGSDCLRRCDVTKVFRWEQLHISFAVYCDGGAYVTGRSKLNYDLQCSGERIEVKHW